jgi:hypothetical protein
MTTAVQNNVSSFNGVRAVCAQQHRLLQRLASVDHYLGGVVAGMWLPGRDSTFDNPVKKAGGFNRPVFLTLEVADNGSLNFSGAVSRIKNDKFVFSVIFAYDVSMLYTRHGGGRVLPANNIVLARRANDLLNALISFGRDVSFGVQRELSPALFPRIICDSNGVIFEDYTPVLGLELPNPAADVAYVNVSRKNPAAKILARHGLDAIDACDATQREQVIGEFCAEFSDVQVDAATAAAALSSPHTPSFSVSLPLETAVHVAPQDVVDALRLLVLPKYRVDAGYADLLRAAKNPQQKLKISRLSSIQLFPVETVQDLPESYAGAVLAPVDWAPAPSVVRPGDTTT